MKKNYTIHCENALYKVGEVVAVCYDCKWSRAVEGVVIGTGLNYVRVSFKPWSYEEAGFVEITAQRDKEDPTHYAGWLLGHGELGILRMLGCSQGDWYSIRKKQELLDAGYRIEAYDRMFKDRSKLIIIKENKNEEV